MHKKKKKNESLNQDHSLERTSRLESIKIRTSGYPVDLDTIAIHKDKGTLDARPSICLHPKSSQFLVSGF
jgi:hypothetical protein